MNEKIKKSIVIEIITDVVIIWLPIDLLYLYFANGWREPNLLILHLEIVLLFLLPVFGIYRLYSFIKNRLTTLSKPSAMAEETQTGLTEDGM